MATSLQATHRVVVVVFVVLVAVGVAGVVTVSSSTGPITIDEADHVAHRVYQRDGGGSYGFVLRGVLGFECVGVEASFAGRPFVVIDSAPTDNYEGVLVASTGQGSIVVRCSNTPEVTASMSDVAVGDVYVVAGQSNAEGRGPALQSFRTIAGEDGVVPSVFDEANVWRVGDDPTDSAGGAGSVWPIVGGHIAANTGTPVAFITVATGGTSLELSPDWQKGGSVCRDLTVNCYQNMIDQVRDSGVNAVKAVLWFQGESEAQFGTTRAGYNQALDNLAADIAVDLPGSPPLVAGVIGPWYKGLAQVNEVRHATMDAWQDNALVLFGPHSYDIEITGDGVFDDKHFAADDEFQTLGYRWWKALDAHFYSGSDGRGPQAESATVIDDSTIDIDFVDSSGLAAVGSDLSVEPWLVTDQGRVIAVQAATVASSTTIQLTLAEPLTASDRLEVSFASDNTAEGATVPTDQSSDNITLGRSGQIGTQDSPGPPIGQNTSAFASDGSKGGLPADPFLKLPVQQPEPRPACALDGLRWHCWLVEWRRQFTM